MQEGNKIRGCSIKNNEKCSNSGTCVVLGPVDLVNELQLYEQEALGPNPVPQWISRTLEGFSPTYSLVGALPTRGELHTKCPVQMAACTGTCATELAKALNTGKETGTESAEFKALFACGGTDNIVTGSRSGCGNMPAEYVGDKWCDADGDFDEAVTAECGYDGGDCLLVDTEQRLDENGFIGLVWISEECNNLYFQGESTMVGFTGSPASFAAVQAASGGTCDVCPGDSLFGGQPIRNSDGDYVCDGAPEGTVDTSQDFFSAADCKEAPEICVVNPCAGYEQDDAATCPSGCSVAGTSGVDETCTANVSDCLTGYVPGDFQAPSTSCPPGCMFTPAIARLGRVCIQNEQAIQVYPNYGTPFPGVTPDSCTGGATCEAVTTLVDGGDVCRSTSTWAVPNGPCTFTKGTQYRLALSFGQANQEIVWVQAATAILDGKQWLAVASSKQPTAPMCTEPIVGSAAPVHCTGVADLSSAAAGCDAATYSATTGDGNFFCSDASFLTEDDCWSSWTDANFDNNDGPIWDQTYTSSQQPCGYRPSQFKKPLAEKHISRGSLMSSIGPDSMTIVLGIEDTTFDSTFPSPPYLLVLHF